VLRSSLFESGEDEARTLFRGRPGRYYEGGGSEIGNWVRGAGAGRVLIIAGSLLPSVHNSPQALQSATLTSHQPYQLDAKPRRPFAFAENPPCRRCCTYVFSRGSSSYPCSLALQRPSALGSSMIPYLLDLQAGRQLTT
jgi:hypothetical protein